MRLWGWMLAAALAVSGTIAAEATAQPARVRVVEKTTYYEGDRKWRGSDRKWARDRRWDNSRRKWGSGRGKWGWRTACRTQWQHGRRERVCRNIRYRRW